MCSSRLDVLKIHSQTNGEISWILPRQEITIWHIDVWLVITLYVPQLVITRDPRPGVRRPQLVICRIIEYGKVE